MYNTDMPTRAELPTSRQLLRSTAIAILAAGAILVTVVLPAEYAIDPTGIGRGLGLTEMGEIKVQLAEEAARDRALDQTPAAPQAVPGADRRSSLLGRVFAELVVGSAAAQSAPRTRTDEVRIPLAPGQGLEVKLVMERGARANYSWTVQGGVVNFDLHGDGAGRQSTSYRQGRGVPGAEGSFEAAFTGNHGWFWRNRGRENVTITLRVNGQYSAITGVP
ncbi:transmembrane anchor protein [Plastoroseomonas hellenica]|uniref:transmembrane anchor protein n=1 Tax=Plastoroseomonas hellenica TaxID=2687306 RepID=UPI001BADE046|nr:transmembrane anchor protein [Plastoroseomonas hellenica]MBR0644943.1 transmembrane anchor protein [Plastoroseomonas hellenica]